MPQAPRPSLDRAMGTRISTWSSRVTDAPAPRPEAPPPAEATLDMAVDFPGIAGDISVRRRLAGLVHRGKLEPLDRRRPPREHRRRLYRRRRDSAICPSFRLYHQVAVNDYQAVHKGDLIAIIDPSDYQAQLALAQANLAAAQATLANLANQRDVQRALISQAEATIERRQGRPVALRSRSQAPARSRYHSRIAGTQQLVEQADANEKRAARSSR